jgi:hypothetical protein
MRWTACAILIVASALVPTLHGALATIAGPHGAYAGGTALLLLFVAPLPLLWPRTDDRLETSSSPIAPIVITVAGLAVLAWEASRLLPVVFAGPLDPNRGDMLVIIDHAIALFLNGGNPYSIHHVPWDAPLSYGPVLWMPFILPYVLKIDLRIATLASQLSIAAFALFTACRLRANRSWPAIAALVALGLALALNPALSRFHEIGQTQIYWPLLLVFCGAMAGARWTAAAICLGLLVAARTTMVAIVPVFVIHLAIIGELSARRVVLLALAAALPFAPFVAADPQTVWYAMFDVYMKVMKNFVWHSTTWAVDTYGITGRLLEHGLERLVEIVQITSLVAVYLVAWRSLRRGARPEPWMGVALLVFSMTTLWPVIYLYFDVWVLLACALVSAHEFRSASMPRVLGEAGVIVGASLAVVLAVAAWKPGASYRLDIGDPSTAGYTGGGFGRDEPAIEDGRSAVWIEGETARIRLPRAGWRGATIRVAIRPNVPQSDLDQRVSASLNDRAIGVARLGDGWQEITFSTRGRDWNYGFNLLDLHFSYALPRSSSTNDRRPVSAAIDWIAVE